MVIGKHESMMHICSVLRMLSVMVQCPRWYRVCRVTTYMWHRSQRVQLPVYADSYIGSKSHSLRIPTNVFTLL